MKRSEVLQYMEANELAAPESWRPTDKMRHWAKEKDFEFLFSFVCLFYSQRYQ